MRYTSLMRFNPARILLYRSAVKRRMERLHLAGERRAREAKCREWERRFPERMERVAENMDCLAVRLVDGAGGIHHTLLTYGLDPISEEFMLPSFMYFDGFARVHQVKRTAPLGYHLTILRAKPFDWDYIWVEEGSWDCTLKRNPKRLPEG